MNAPTKAKYEALRASIERLNSLAVAFSGGVDSTLLLYAACEALPGRVLAVTARSATSPAEEIDQARELAVAIGAPLEVLDSTELEDPAFRANPPDRCYHCKRLRFGALVTLARERGLDAVIEGSNVDDAGDYRPGERAVEELGIRSPLRAVGLTKAEIRTLSREHGLPTWDKPALACLASRVPYGVELTEERLARVGAAERALRGLGLRQLRVRDHGDVARLELPPDELSRAATAPLRDQILEAITGAGYRYVALDLQGYRTGAMNEVLDPEEMEP